MKKSLSERDVCTKFITPAVRQAGWDVLSQIREEVSVLHVIHTIHPIDEFMEESQKNFDALMSA
jgi:type I site-specific restriction endonuclease